MHVHVINDPDVAVNYQPYPPGPDNGLLVLYGSKIAFVDIEAQAQRGAPRIDYARVYVTLPQDVTEDRAVEVFRENFPYRRTVGFSLDDSGIGNLSDRTSIIYDVPESGRLALIAWFDLYYPGVKVIFV